MKAPAIMHDMIAGRLNEIEREFEEHLSNDRYQRHCVDMTSDLIELCRAALHNLKPFAWPGIHWVTMEVSEPTRCVARCQRCGGEMDMLAEVRKHGGHLTAIEMANISRNWSAKHADCLPWIAMEEQVSQLLMERGVTTQRGHFVIAGSLAHTIVRHMQIIIEDGKAGKL